MSAKIKLVVNSFTLLLVLIANYLSNTGALSSQTVGEVSRKYDTLFTPAGYAFSIWGLIYLLLIAFVAFQWYQWIRQKKDEVVNKTSYWFVLANFANGLWIFSWTNEAIGLSVLLILALLFSLIMLVKRLRLETYDAPLPIIVFVWWPLCVYFGWIILASVANISAYLTSIGWEGGPLSPETWTVVLILISAAIYAWLIFSRNLREAAFVGVWGLVAISYRQWNEVQSIAITAFVAAFVLFIYITYHGYKNKATSPMAKWKERRS